jgi:hypothetical protein
MLGLAAIVVLLSLLDGWMTAKIIRRHGLKVELNQITQFVSRYSIKAGIIAGITVPTALILALSLLLKSQVILALYATLKVLYGAKQLRTHWVLIHG